MAQFLWVCLGGAAGTGARHLLAGWTLRQFGTSYPYGTLAVNVLGSLLIAMLMYAGVERAAVPPVARVALATGVLGGFTTYSTFSYETMKYLQEGAWGVAILNVLVTVFACLAACFAGWSGARWLFGS